MPDSPARDALATHEVTPKVERHMEEKELCAGMTKTQVRAWAEDAKRAAEQGGFEDDGCPECGGEVDGDGATVGTETGLCIECATTKASGQDVTIEL